MDQHPSRTEKDDDGKASVGGASRPDFNVLEKND